MAGLVPAALVGPRDGVRRVVLQPRRLRRHVHRALARGYADLLAAAGLEFEPPSLEPEGGQPVGWRQDVAWMVREGAPWVGRRARDLGPWAVRMAWEETRRRRTPVSG